MFKPIVLGLLLIVSTKFGFAQDVLILDQPQSGTQDNHAPLEVRFRPGYAYTPVGADYMRGRVTDYSGGLPIQWTNLENVSTTNDALTKIGGRLNNWDGNANSTNILEENGWMRYTITDLTSEDRMIFGFADECKVFHDYLDVLYGYFIREGQIWWAEDGKWSRLFSSFNIGDELILERIGSVMYYRINGTTVRQSQVDANTRFIVGTSIFKEGTSLSQPRVSFDSNALRTTATTTPLLSSLGPSGIQLNPSGGQPPYTYSWAPEGQTTKDISNIGFGDHTVTITDVAGNSMQKTFTIDYAAQWENLSYLTSQNDELTRTSGGFTWQGRGRTSNILEGNGQLRYKVQTTQGKWSIGLADESKEYYTPGDIKYGFSFANGELRRRETVFGYRYMGFFDEDEEFIIKREGNIVLYLRNGRKVYQEEITDPNIRFVAVVTADTEGSTINSPTLSFDNTAMSAIISPHPLESATASSSVMLNPRGGQPPYTYLWSPGGQTTKDISNIEAGDYTVTITDALGKSIQKKATVDYVIQWEALENVSFENDVLTKISGATSWWTGHAQSRNILEEDGFLRYTVENTNESKMIGFVDEGKTFYDYYDLLYGFYFRNDGVVYRFDPENGQTIITRYHENDKFVLKKEANTIYYYRNNDLIHQAEVNPNLRLRVGASISTSGGKFTRPTVSFDANALTASTTSTPLMSSAGPSGIQLNVSGGQPPYSYSWSPEGQTTKDISNIGYGNHTVTITDAAGKSIQRTANIAYAVQWENLENLTVQNDVITKTSGGRVWNGNANSDNILKGNGWMKYTVQSLNEDKYWGLADESKTYNDLYDILYGFRIHGGNNTLYTVDNGLSTYTGRIANLNDELVIERIGNIIYYKRNGKVLQEKVVDGSLDLTAAVSIPGENIVFEKPEVSFDDKALTASLSTIPINSSIGASAIQATPKGGQPPYTYLWSPSGKTTKDISNVSLGDHTVTISDAAGNVINRTAEMAYAIAWESDVDLTFQNDVLTKTSGGNNVFTGVTSSTESYTGSVKMRYVVKSVGDNNKYWGFADASSTDPDYTEILYGLRFVSGSLWSVFNGVSVDEGTHSGLQDELIVERKGNTVYFKRNGRVLREEVVDGSIALKAAVSIAQQGAAFENPTVSYGTYTIVPTINQGSCAHLDYELSSNFYVVNDGNFCFTYNEEYNDPKIEFNIYDATRDLVATQDDFSLDDIIYGENRIVLDLTRSGKCIGAGYFVLEVINDKKEKFYLRLYKDNTGCTVSGNVGGDDEN